MQKGMKNMHNESQVLGYQPGDSFIRVTAKLDSQFLVDDPAD